MSRLLFPSLLIILSIGAFFTYVQPTYEEAQAAIAQIEQYDVTLDKAKELQELQNSLVTRYNNFSNDDLERLEKLLPKNVDNVRLIIEIESIARAHEITLSNVLVTQLDAGANNAPSENNEFSVIPRLRSVGLQISLDTDYDTFKDFIRDLESSLRIVDINDVTFTVSRGDDEDVTTYTVLLQTYWLE